MNKKIKTMMLYGMLSIFVIIAVYPIYHMIITSFKLEREYLDNRVGPPLKFVLTNYIFAFKQGNMLMYLKNNLILLPLGMIVYLFVCITAGFAFGKLRFPYRLTVFTGVLFLMIFPQMLLSMQIFQLCVKLQLTNSFLGVILVWTAYFAPFGTYIMTTFFSSLPTEIVESARIDGASTWSILNRIAVPMALPMIGIIVIIGFQSMWTELPFSMLLLQRMEMRTVTLGVAMIQGQFGIPDTQLSAIIMTASLIPFAIFLFFQKYIATGAFAGAVKG